MWTGRDIVRTKGRRAKGTIGETLVITKQGEVMGIEGALERGLYGPERLWYKTRFDLVSGAPNLALNIQDPKRLALETWVLAVAGHLLQLAVFAVAWLATYRWQLSEVSPDGRSYGYPLYVSGTTLQSAGVLGSAYAIQAATIEHYLRYQENQRTGKTDVAVVRLQQACTVGDQDFQSFAIFNAFDNPNILFSRRAENHGKHGYVQTISLAVRGGQHLTGFDLVFANHRYLPSLLVTLSCIAALLGFGLQWGGLRTLHWQTGLIQLGLTAVMAGARTYARRRLARERANFKILETHEAAWLAHGVASISDARREISEDNTSPVPVLGWEELWKRFSETDTSQVLEVPTVQPHNHFTLILPETPSTSIRRVSEDSLIGRGQSSRWVTARVDAFAAFERAAPFHAPDKVEKSSHRLIGAIVGVANLLRLTGHVAWKDEPVFASLHPNRTVRWEIPIICHQGRPILNNFGFNIDFLESMDGSYGMWDFPHHQELLGLLCFWLCTLDGRDPSWHRGLGAKPHPSGTSFHRIVGSSTHVGQSGRDATLLADWTGNRIWHFPTRMDSAGLPSEPNSTEDDGPDYRSPTFFGVCLSRAPR
jgi:hypothetical protein